MRTVAPTLLVILAISIVTANISHAEIAWENNLRSAHTKAQAEGKLLLMHFYRDDCTWCDRLEAGAFKTSQVGETINENFVPVKVHAGKSPKLAKMFKVTKFPTDVIVTTEGKTLSHSVSPQNADRYVAMLTHAVPSLDAVRTAQKPADSTPAPSTQASVAPSDTYVPPAGSIPGYAAGSASASNVALPGKSLSTGVQARLAGTRSPGMSLEMPSLAGSDAAAAPDTPTYNLPGMESPNVIGLPDPTGHHAANLEHEGHEHSDHQISVQEPNGTQMPAGVTVQTDDVTVAAADEDPELAMQGFCAVTVINEDKWVEGKPEYGVIHLGKLYLFHSDQAMKTFLADPVPYTPVLNEIDVVRFFEERKIVPGKREWGLKDPVYNRMFFFADEAAMNHFYKNYERYTDAAIQVMDRAVKDANPGS